MHVTTALIAAGGIRWTQGCTCRGVTACNDVVDDGVPQPLAVLVQELRRTHCADDMRCVGAVVVRPTQRDLFVRRSDTKEAIKVTKNWTSRKGLPITLHRFFAACSVYGRYF